MILRKSMLRCFPKSRNVARTKVGQSERHHEAKQIKLQLRQQFSYGSLNTIAIYSTIFFLKTSQDFLTQFNVLTNLQLSRAIDKSQKRTTVLQPVPPRASCSPKGGFGLKVGDSNEQSLYKHQKTGRLRFPKF